MIDLPRQHFRTILADPPWLYVYSTRKTEKPGTGWLGAVENHYRTMPLDEIKALPVSEIAAPDALLLMWAVNSQLPRCLEVLPAWGFEYRGLITWAKLGRNGRPHFGNGYWCRGATEHMILGVRKATKPGARDVRSYFVAPVREHSRKPDEQYEIAERLGAAPRIELFARARREGWEAWGDQAPPRMRVA